MGASTTGTGTSRPPRLSGPGSPALVGAMVEVVTDPSSQTMAGATNPISSPHSVQHPLLVFEHLVYIGSMTAQPIDSHPLVAGVSVLHAGLDRMALDAWSGLEPAEVRRL